MKNMKEDMKKDEECRRKKIKEKQRTIKREGS